MAVYKPLESPFKRNQKYVGEGLHCGRCNKLVNEYYFETPDIDPEYVVCVKCKLELMPPRLSFRVNSCCLWNITQSKYESYMKIEDFIDCGWFVRQEVVRTQQSPPRRLIPRSNMSKEVMLEYYGSRKCLRVPHHQFFYDNMAPCNNVLCKP